MTSQEPGSSGRGFTALDRRRAAEALEQILRELALRLDVPTVSSEELADHYVRLNTAFERSGQIAHALWRVTERLLPDPFPEDADSAYRRELDNALPWKALGNESIGKMIEDTVQAFARVINDCVDSLKNLPGVPLPGEAKLRLAPEDVRSAADVVESKIRVAALPEKRRTPVLDRAQFVDRVVPLVEEFGQLMGELGKAFREEHEQTTDALNLVITAQHRAQVLRLVERGLASQAYERGARTTQSSLDPDL